MRISDWSSDVCSSDLAWLQLGDVAAAQAHGALAPVGRIAEPDGVARAVVLDDAVARQHGEEGLGDVFAAASGAGLGETRLPALQHRLLGLDAVLRRLAEEERARQRAVIARSEERTVGEECVSTVCSRWTPD